MERYYCRPIKRYVCFAYKKIHGVSKVYMVAHTNGELLNCITLDVPTGRNFCAYIDNKTYPWLATWLVEKDVAHPTHRSLFKDGFVYHEFKFRKEY